MTKRKPTEPNRRCKTCDALLEPGYRADKWYCSGACASQAFHLRRRPACSFDGCTFAVQYIGLCAGHYAQRGRGEELRPLERRRRVVDGMKVCAICEQNKPITQFAPRGGSVNPYCIPCRVRYQAARSYNITIAELDELRAVTICQNDGCGREVEMNIDHCHDTGMVRGVLCKQCNLALGHVRDDIEVLRGLIAYLERSRT